VIRGVDVSHWQADRGAIRWGEVAQAGYDFAYCKATQGKDFIDTAYLSNITGAKTAGLAVGSYHYWIPEVDSILQARHFMNIVAGLPHNLPYMFDLEQDSTLRNSQLIANAFVFVQEVEQLSGEFIAIYTRASYYNQKLKDERTLQYPIWAGEKKLWVANYTTASQPILPISWDDYWLWQYTSTGRVPGIIGDVDLNRFQGTKEELLGSPPIEVSMQLVSWLIQITPLQVHGVSQANLQKFTRHLNDLVADWNTRGDVLDYGG